VNTEEFKKLLSKVKWDKIATDVDRNEVVIVEGRLVLSIPRYLTWPRDLMEFCRDNKILWMNRGKHGFNPITKEDEFWHELRKVKSPSGSVLVTLATKHTLTIQGALEPSSSYKIDDPLSNWMQIFKTFCDDNHLVWKNQKDWIPTRYDSDILPNQFIYGGEKAELFCLRLNQMVDNHYQGMFPYAELTKDQEVKRVTPLVNDSDENLLNHYVRGFLYGWDAHE
jgi:hypothetical protein